jgi:hypothetical protein
MQIGDALRGQVTRRLDGRWVASLTNTDLGQHPSKEVAVAAVETRISMEMNKILEDWAIYQGAGDRKRV